MAFELKRAAPKERRAILASYAQRTGYHPTYLYQIAKKNGFASGRKKREDSGALRCGLNDGQVQFFCSLLQVTGRENKGPIMPLERAIQIAEDSGIVERGQFTPATLARILRRRKASARHLRMPEPTAEMRSLHPNHVHVFDVSVCIQYYRKDGALSIMSDRDYYKNKPENFAKLKKRLLRYLMVDHFSGAFFPWYYETSGETQDNLYDFALRAWGGKGDARYPFRGVPNILLMDTGAANKSAAIINVLEKLDVEIPKGDPYQPTRQGTVESMHNVWERWFESGLRLDPAISIEALNADAVDYATWFNASRPHTRHKMTRTQCWLIVKPEQVRELPAGEVMQDLYANPEEERTVKKNLTISYAMPGYRDNDYGVEFIPGIHVGAKVLVVKRPLKLPTLEVRYEDASYEVKPRGRLSPLEGAFSERAAVIGKEYRAPRETETQKVVKRALNLAYGEDGLDKRGHPKKGAVPFAGGLKVFGHHAEKLGDLAFIPKEGTPIEVDRGIPERRISIMELLGRLHREIGKIKPELNAAIRARYGDSIEETEAAKVVEHIKMTGRLPEEAAGEGRESIAL